MAEFTRKSLFGLRPQEAERFLETIGQEQEAETQRLRSTLEAEKLALAALQTRLSQREKAMDLERQLRATKSRLSDPGAGGALEVAATSPSEMGRTYESVFTLDPSGRPVVPRAQDGSNKEWAPGTVGEMEISRLRAPEVIGVGGTVATPSPRSEVVQLRPWGEKATPVGPAPRPGVRPLLGYLMDKVLGRDLQGADGQVIAPKGAPITAELIEEAVRQGSLPELILHMEWPEGGVK